MGWVGRAWGKYFGCVRENTHIIYNALVQGAFFVGCRIENSHYVAGDKFKKKAHRHIDRNTYQQTSLRFMVRVRVRVRIGLRLGFWLG